MTERRMAPLMHDAKQEDEPQTETKPQNVRSPRGVIKDCGSAAQVAAFTGAAGEVTPDTTSNRWGTSAGE